MFYGEDFDQSDLEGLAFVVTVFVLGFGFSVVVRAVLDFVFG